MSGSLDETWEPVSLLAIQEKINRDIANLAAKMWAPGLFKDRVVPEHEPYDIRWKDPQMRPTPLSPEEWAAYSADVTGFEDPFRGWIQRWILGLDDRLALSEQEIPAEGTE